ncbi:MAG: hypothetical protein UW81_C0006G0020 [Candidatus Giovannonibacteria bacterium GW2011_GWC2_44_9]|uniref:Uncharacterized protein n=3 Tax=Candidatus Giovannoniibacteriota TaxID=1752738 RepID=A0A0G1LW40_9BACT|nr:MAG: hypothetical protein UW49_C0004G0065 [Candidatus Giovannonibacteria bacterium GW2011_GWB1_44_23]KKT63954.1 MAG: hypothetical protein UW57_C0004G0064 [Candidatus Giovannonibacteria bacterium GW2011_GWA1_44_29]KKT84095.1 MAG: hypothetical protein UW81_C0006G0020 [Candidatus Giovannonibacteria bacterium GW2011_GWC2_44_9]KKT91667.1 MAG: hypothetical protein UW93_C0004G0065 [Parcubacteria group bacterium GW2011_GWC1_45_13]
MATITIPKELAQNKDLIAVPRNTYGEFLTWLKKIKSARTFKPTKAELKALARGRKNFANGNYVTLNQLDNELDRNS